VIDCPAPGEAALLLPVWQVPANVHGLVSTRSGGVSEGHYATLNLAQHVNDDPALVAANRQRLQDLAGLAGQPLWLQQVHGKSVLLADHSAAPVTGAAPQADAAYASAPGRVLAIMVADCLPILLCSRDGKEIAAIHAGWRGLAENIIAETIGHFSSTDITAWLGPAIGPCHYEVDGPLKRNFTGEQGFSKGRDAAHWMLDLGAIARQQLADSGVGVVEGGDVCTFCDQRFFSYRRDGETGRFAVFIWRD
jgi:YfiH family protein